jgi:hypothetical protein
VNNEAAYCEFAILKFHYSPTQWKEMNIKERAFVIACIDNYIKELKEVK